MAEPVRWPGYLPYPHHAIRRWGGRASVPNRQAIDWPQSQFAPLYLPPGSASFQPYRYSAGGPLKTNVPLFQLSSDSLIPEKVTAFHPNQPGGDTSRVRTKPWPGRKRHKGPKKVPQTNLAGLTGYGDCGDCGCGDFGDCGDCGCGDFGDCGCQAKNNPTNFSTGLIIVGLLGAAFWAFGPARP